MTERIKQLEPDGEFAEQLFVHGSGCRPPRGGRVAALGGPARYGDRPRPGPPLLLGLSGLPGAVRAREGRAPARRFGDRVSGLSGGHALEPEQSTAAIIAYHLQAVYFGAKSGFVPAEKKGDELIAGTDRGGKLPPDADPEGDGTVEAESDEPSMDAATA